MVDKKPKESNNVTPYFTLKGASEAIEFYKYVLGAEETFRMDGPDGKLMHAALRIGDSILMLTDECPEMGAFDALHFGGSPVTVHLSVADADASFVRATAAGATPLMPVTEMFWGARYGVFKDPYGHSWSVATQVKDMSPEEIQAAAAKACAEHAASAAA